MENSTFALLSKMDGEIYTAEEIAIILAALASAVAAIVYSFKHIKSSDCCGFHCKQETTADIEQAHIEHAHNLTTITEV